MQAHPQEPPEVYSNRLPPSVGETTGGIHPMPSGINISAPPEVDVKKNSVVLVGSLQQPTEVLSSALISKKVLVDFFYFSLMFYDFEVHLNYIL